MLYHRIHGSVIFILLLFIGCSDSGSIFYKTVHIPRQAVDIVSISQDRPAEILFVVAGIKADGYDPSIQRVSAERVGNTIFLRARGSEEIFDSGGYCTSAVEATDRHFSWICAFRVGMCKVFVKVIFRFEKNMHL